MNLDIAAPTPLMELLLERHNSRPGRRSRPVAPPPPDLTCEPPQKWTGGKRGLLDQRPDAFPPRETVRRYHEPFAGGAALFFLRYAGVPSILNDSNRFLTLTYRMLREHPARLVAALRELVEAYNAWSAEEHAAAGAFYLVQRQLFHAPTLDPVQRAALFLFLVRADFNGLWRVNAAGRFNVSWGKRRSLAVDEPKLLAASRALASATIRNVDFESTILDPVVGAARGRFAAGPGDFVFFDPPYAPVSKTASFNAYQAGGAWSARGKDRLWLVALMCLLERRGIRFTACDADTPETRELYATFRVESATRAGTMNSDGAKRGDVPELLVRNWQ